jgi:hypothetical protein
VEFQEHIIDEMAIIVGWGGTNRIGSKNEFNPQATGESRTHFNERHDGQQ